MKTVKSNKVLFAVVISFSALIWILIFSIIAEIAEPRNGRNFTIHIVDSIVLQADPPAKRLLKYMEKKYDREFVQIKEDPSVYSTFKDRHHDWGVGNWAYWHNGIIVTTKDDDSEYYHVCDNYGTYLDNYGCYLINDEAESELNEKISSALPDKEVKAACFPRDIQYKELPAYMTVQEYLHNASYCLCIVICGEGGDARNDYDEICKALDVKSGEGWMTLTYYDKNVYDNINMNDFQALIDPQNYNADLEYDIYTSEPCFVSGDDE